MNHLKILKYVDYFSAATLVFVGLLTGGSIGLTLFVVAKADPNAMVAVIPSAGITAVVLLLLLGMAVLALVAARGIEHGRARLPQTILAVLSLASVPLGTIFALYSLWVCWSNEETKATFDNNNLKKELALLAVGVVVMGAPMVPLIVFSITAIIPFDHAALDAEWEPLADRSQRVQGEGCGLNEVTTPSGCEPARPTGVKLEEVSFATRSQTMGFTQLNGAVYLPQGLEVPRPAAILVHGSGPQDRHANSPGEIINPMYSVGLPIFDEIAMNLAEQGLVVLTYDKRACGGCYPNEHENADYSEFRFQLFMEDAMAGIDWLEARDDVDGDAIVVLGHSQGGGFAPHIGATDDRVVAVVMLAGFVRTFREGLTTQMERVADIRRKQWDYFSAWNVKLQTASLEACMARLDVNYDPGDDCVGGGVSLQALAEYDVLNRTTLDVIANLDKPLCALNGTVDRNVEPEQLMDIREASRGDAEFHLLKGVGHGLRNLVESTDPPVIDPQVTEVISTFLSSVTVPPEPVPPEPVPPEPVPPTEEAPE